MAIRLKTGSYWYPLGSEKLLHSFFSTIAFHLENNEWGSKYPLIMKELYQGNLHNNIDHALHELDDIRYRLKKYTSDQIVWDINDMSREPPWGDDIKKNKVDLSSSFISIHGENLFDIFQNAFNKAKEIGEAIKMIR